MSTKNKIIAVVLIVLAIIIAWHWKSIKAFLSSNTQPTTAPPANECSGNMVSAVSEAGKTTASYSINPTTTLITYLLTYVPSTTGRLSTPATQTKEINCITYKKFITDYPTAKADGNVLNEY